jgi:light-regulated signal transduction histidine kinase (bacteriophytochrome)
LRERDKAQTLLFQEQKEHLAKQINYQKEMLFTKRIYHTHHKAEKIGGFIKEDLRVLTPENIGPVKHRIGKYSSFIARVIYDMKWYDPPLHSIRGPMFRTNVNDVIRFIVENIFQRVADQRSSVDYVLELDPAIPEVDLNEFVIWEVLEPLIQNSLDHGGKGMTTVTIGTRFDAGHHRSIVRIADNGKGIRPDLLERNDKGIRKIFLEHVASGTGWERGHSGYGCCIAYEIATQRFGWEMDAENTPEGGSQFTITMRHEGTPNA